MLNNDQALRLKAIELALQARETDGILPDTTQLLESAEKIARFIRNGGGGDSGGII
jgi:hypothetical protein